MKLHEKKRLFAAMGMIVFVGIVLFAVRNIFTQSDRDARERNEQAMSSNTGEAFLVVHLEPSETPSSLSHPAEAWDSLVQIVEDANTYNIDLTLLFTPQWGEYVLQNDERLALVRSWETQGHELGLHHHGASHANPDGFTNVSSALDTNEYRGDIEDMMKILNQLPASGKMVTAGMTDEATDWPDGFFFNAKTSTPPLPEDILSIPTTTTYQGQRVTEVLKGGYVLDRSFELSLEEIENAIEQQKGEEILGVVVEDTAFSEHYNEIIALFELFKERSVSVYTISSILQ